MENVKYKQLVRILKENILSGKYGDTFPFLSVRSLIRRYVENVAFRGIRFELSQFELPSNDVNDRQASASVSAAVRLAGARRCRFEDCTFSDVGGYAVDILKGSRDNVLSRCTMTRLGAGGVRLDGGVAGCSPAELTSGNVVEDCEIGPYGLDFRSGVGVLLKNAERTRIIHNHIHDGLMPFIDKGTTRRSTRKGRS